MSQSLSLDNPSDLVPSGSVLQLRVVAGLHAGAAVLLDESHATTLTLGSGPGHDVVLRDAPGSAELVSRESMWWWCEPGFERLLPADCSWKWGAVHFSMTQQVAPWRTPLAWFFERLPVVDALDDEASAVNQVAPTTSSKMPDVNDSEDPVFKAVPGESAVEHGRDFASKMRDPTVSKGPGWVGALLGLLCASVALVWWLSVSDDAGSVVPPLVVPVASQGTPTNTVEDVARLIDVLHNKGYSDTVRVKVRDDGRPILLGVVADDDALDQLLAVVSQVTRRIVLNVMTEPEFKLRVQALQATAPPGTKLSALPIGLLEVQLSNAATTGWPNVQAWIDAELPEAVHVYAAGLNVGSSKEALAHKIMPQLKAGPEIKAILGGVNPYVLLANGEKWLPGGISQGWTLLAIDADALVLQNSKGESLRSPR